MTRKALRSEGGFTLLEIMISIILLSTAALMLMATIGSQQKMDALSRERAIATCAIRAYVEAMRQNYPAKGSTDMTNLINDTTTPVDYIPSTTEASALRD